MPRSVGKEYIVCLAATHTGENIAQERGLWREQGRWESGRGAGRALRWEHGGIWDGLSRQPVSRGGGRWVVGSLVRRGGQDPQARV